MAACDDPFYLHLRTSRRSERTAQNYLDDFRMFERWCHQREMNPVSAERVTVQAYLADELARVSPNTVAHRQAALRAYFAFIGRSEVMEGIQIKQSKIAPRAPLEDGDFDKLLTGCRNDRDRAMLTLGYECGLRVSEVVGIHRDDVKLHDRLLLVRGKGSKERWVGLTPRAALAILPFLTGSPGPIWFLSNGKPMTAKRAKRAMDEICRRSAVSAHWHKLRTTFAHRFLEATHDLDSLQTLMGHADANTTRRYAAYGAQQRALDQMRRYSQAMM